MSFATEETWRKRSVKSDYQTWRKNTNQIHPWKRIKRSNVKMLILIKLQTHHKWISVEFNVGICNAFTRTRDEIDRSDYGIVSSTSQNLVKFGFQKSRFQPNIESSEIDFESTFDIYVYINYYSIRMGESTVNYSLYLNLTSINQLNQPTSVSWN